MFTNIFESAVGAAYHWLPTTGTFIKRPANPPTSHSRRQYQRAQRLFQRQKKRPSLTSATFTLPARLKTTKAFTCALCASVSVSFYLLWLARSSSNLSRCHSPSLLFLSLHRDDEEKRKSDVARLQRTRRFLPLLASKIRVNITKGEAGRAETCTAPSLSRSLSLSRRTYTRTCAF